jgi:hypothetical protein
MARLAIHTVPFTACVARVAKHLAEAATSFARVAKHLAEAAMSFARVAASVTEPATSLTRGAVRFRAIAMRFARGATRFEQDGTPPRRTGSRSARPCESTADTAFVQMGASKLKSISRGYASWRHFEPPLDRG